MNNTDIFNFPFTDRCEERKQVNLFLTQNRQPNILWINGISGVGKTSFVKNVLERYQSGKVVYTNVQSHEQDPNYLARFLLNLQECTTLSFVEFVKTNYDKILDIPKKAISQVLKLYNLDFDTLLDVAFDSTKAILDYNKKRQSLAQITNVYIEKLIKADNLVLVLDNFGYCEPKSMDVLQQVIRKFSGSQNVKFIIITSDQMIDKRPELGEFLMEHIPVQTLMVQPFDDVLYFRQIISNIFEVNKQLANEIEHIFHICGGSPKSLKGLLQNLLRKDAIYFTQQDLRAQIDVKFLQKYLLENAREKPTSINPALYNVYQKLILHVIVVFGAELYVELLIDILKLLGKTMLDDPPVPSEKWLKEIEFLREMEILAIEETENGYIVFVDHDLTFYTLKNIFSKYMNRHQISHYIYQYLHENREKLSFAGWSTDQTEALLALHAYRGRRMQWQKLNFAAGRARLDRGRIFEAHEFFLRLLEDLSPVSSADRLIIAQGCFECGDYDNALQLLNVIDEKALTPEDQYQYHYTAGKVYFVTLNTYKAIDHFNNAIEKSGSDEESVSALAMKHLGLLETPDGRVAAKALFDETIKAFENPPNTMVKFFRNCSYHYTGNMAQQYFSKAMDIAKAHGDDIECAYIHNNHGVELFRTGYSELSFDDFNLAKDILGDVKPHESAYPLCNLATRAIYYGNCTGALEYLAEANFWSSSAYIKLVCKTLRFVCMNLLKREAECEQMACWFHAYLFNNEIIDPAITRKLGINLCIYYSRIGDVKKARLCIEKVYPALPGTISEYRGTILMNRLCKTSYSIDHTEQSHRYYTDLSFEPWFTYLSHD